MIKIFRSLEDTILKLIIDRTPNAVTRDIITSEFQNKYTNKQIDSAIKKLIRDRKIVNDLSGTNRAAEYLTKIKRESFYLKKYDSNLPYFEKIVIGNISISRVLDGDTARAEDINYIIESIATIYNKLGSEFKKQTAKQVSKIYKDLIVIFGIFVSIFSLLIISTEKLIKFNPLILKSESWGELFWKSSALFLPIGIILIGFLFLIWIIARKT